MAGEGGLLLIRRSVLVLLLLTCPPLLTWGMYHASVFVLDETHRVINPHVLWYATVGELLVFFFIAILEVKDRW